MSENIARRNHYIPQRYQLGFARDQEIWVYDREDDTFRRSHPKRIGMVRDFYTVQDSEGKDSDAVEKVLAKLEGEIWPIIDQLSGKDPLLPVGQDLEALALFIAFFRTRTPVFEREQQHSVNDFYNWWMKAQSPTPEALAEAIERTTGEAMDPNEADRLHNLIHSDGYEVESPRQNNIKLMLDLSLTLCDELKAMRWSVIRSPEESAFITCDNPFVLIPPPGHDFSLSGVGVRTPGASVIVPLHARAAILLENRDSRRPTMLVARKNFVRLVNPLIAANSDRYIFARDEAHLRSVVKRTRAGEWRHSFRAHLSAPQFAR